MISLANKKCFFPLISEVAGTVLLMVGYHETQSTFHMQLDTGCFASSTGFHIELKMLQLKCTGQNHFLL